MAVESIERRDRQVGRCLRAGRALTLVALPLSWALGNILLVEWLDTHESAAWRLASGEVIEHEQVTVYAVATRPKVTIRVDGSGETVHAVLSMNAADQVPERVTFRYSGDASREVQLLEEDDPLRYALLFLLTPPGVLLAIQWLLWRRRPRHVLLPAVTR